jgi:type IV pilus assembly protein PilM
MFSQNKNFPIGIDFSDTSIKMIQLSKRSDKIGLQALGRGIVPNGVIENGQIKDVGSFIKIFKNCLADPAIGKFTSNDVVLGLYDEVAFIKMIMVEKSSLKLEESIKLEMEKHIPYALDDIIFDWQTIKDEQSNNNISVLVGASPKNLIDHYSQIFTSAGLSLVACELKSQAVCRSLLSEESIKFKGPFDKNYAIIDIGMKTTNLVVYSHNTILFSLSLPISGNDINDKISKTLQIDLEQAEKAKIICGFDSTKAQGIIVNILSDVVNDLLARIKDSLLYYHNHFSQRGDIKKILLTGGGANIKDLDKIIAKGCQVETILANTFVNCEGIKDTDIKNMIETHNIDMQNDKRNKETLSLTQNFSSSLSCAVGLALREIFIFE